MSNNVITSIRINADLLEKIKIYAEIEGKTQTDFINEKLEEAFSFYFNQRSGGAILTLPNPQIFNRSEEKAEAAIEILQKAFADLKQLHINYPFPQDSILAFFEQRLFYELPEDEECFKANMLMDGTQNGNVTEIKK